MKLTCTLSLFLLVISTAVCNAQQKPVSANAGSISKTANIENARAAHTATLLSDGKVLIAGGMRKDGELYDSAELFDPAKNTFTPVSGKMVKKRVSHTATVLKDGKILLVGGWSVSSSPESSVEIFDPASKTFKAVASGKFKRSGHSATLLENGKVLIAGGSDGTRNLDEAELYDPKSNSFEFVGKMNSVRNVHAATELNDGRILITGGEVVRGTIASDAEIFNPKTNKFTPVSAKMSAVRYKHDAIRLTNGNVLVFGGSDSRDWRGKLKSAEIFNPENETFTLTNDMNFARFKISETSVMMRNGKVLIAGGNEEAEIYNPETRAFSKVSGSLGKSLHYSSVTLLNDGRALIVGGYEFVPSGEPTSTNQAWIFEI